MVLVRVVPELGLGLGRVRVRVRVRARGEGEGEGEGAGEGDEGCVVRDRAVLAYMFMNHSTSYDSVTCVS